MHAIFKSRLPIRTPCCRYCTKRFAASASHGSTVHAAFLIRLAQKIEERRANLGCESQTRQLVCIKNQQALFRTFAAFDTRVRDVPPLLSCRRFATCQLCCANPFSA